MFYFDCANSKDIRWRTKYRINVAVNALIQYIFIKYRQQKQSLLQYRLSYIIRIVQLHSKLMDITG